MNLITLQLARFVRDLMSLSDNQVRIAERNFDRSENLDDTQVAIGALGSAMRLSGGERYDGEAEVMYYHNVWRQTCTIDFYGADSFELASKYANIAAGQSGIELQRGHGLTVLRPSVITDLSNLMGRQYDPRHQVEVNVMMGFRSAEPVMRIDSAVFEIRTERGIVVNEKTQVLMVNGQPLYVNNKPLRISTS